MGLVAKIFGVISIVILLWGGYVAYTLKTATPEISVSWGPVTEEYTVVNVDVNVSRPLLVPVTLNGMEIRFMDEQIGKLDHLDYSPTATSVNVGIKLNNSRVVDAILEYFENGESGTFELSLTPSFLGLFSKNLSFQYRVNEKILEQIHLTAPSQEIAGISLAKTPELLDTRVRYAGRNENEAVFTVELFLYNPNPYPLPLLRTGFKLWANGLKIGEGETAKSIILPSKGREKVELKVHVLTKNIPKVWELHVKNDETSYLRAEISMRLSISAGGLNVTRDVTLKTVDRTIKTNIIDEINEALKG